MSVSVGRAGAGETHAGRDGEGEPTTGPGCNEGEWSHTGMTVTHMRGSAAHCHQTYSHTTMGNTSPHHKVTCIPHQDGDMLWTPLYNS